MILIPFGDYKNFNDCVRKNQDKKSPEGFCADLHKKITGKWPGEAQSFRNRLKELKEHLSKKEEVK